MGTKKSKINLLSSKAHLEKVGGKNEKELKRHRSGKRERKTEQLEDQWGKKKRLFRYSLGKKE